MNDLIILLAIAVLVSLNVIIILIEFKKNRRTKAFIDACLLIAVAVLFSGSFNALVVGTFGSFFISVYLFFSSPLSIRRSV